MAFTLNHRALPAVAALLWVGCARTELDEPVPVLPTSYRPLDGVGTPRWVEPGLAWVGPLGVRASTGDLEQLPCDPSLLGRTFLVTGYFLDVDEIRGADYEACVQQAGCQPPATQLPPALPAVLTPNEVEAYCGFRGGRLPSAAELARASAGDDIGHSTEVFYREWLACDDQDFVGAECDGLAFRAIPFPLGGVERAGPVPPRSDRRDRGPFGHWDLFGSLTEATMTIVAGDEVARWCGYSRWFLDPKTFAEPEGNENVRVMHAPAWDYASSSPLRFPLEDPNPTAIGFFVDAEVTGMFGGRCAYDPAYVLESSIHDDDE